MAFKNKLLITWVKVGHGDCVMVRLPNGQTLLIDCGTLRSEAIDFQAIYDSIYSRRFLNNYNHLDTLIMSHQDGDHYNNAYAVLRKKDKATVLGKRKRGKIRSTVGKIYLSDYSGNFTMNDVGYNLWAAFGNSHFRRIHVRNDKNGNLEREIAVGTFQYPTFQYIKSLPSATIAGVPKASSVDYDNGEYVNSDGFVQIMDGTGEDNVETRVSILAAAVPEYKRADLIEGGFLDENEYYSPQKNNSVSIVTLLEYGGEKILFTADATRSTEMFLSEAYGDKIKNLTIMQLGHHGSDKTSSSSEFIEQTAPKQAVISEALKNSGHHSPSGDVLDRVMETGKLATTDEQGDIYYWRYESEKNDLSDDEHIEETDPKYDYIYIKREDFNKAVFITGSDGNVEFTFPDDLS